MAELNAPKLPKGEYPELSPNPNEKNGLVFAGNETPTVPGNNEPKTKGEGSELLFQLAKLLIGSKHVVVDLTEDGGRLQVRLDKGATDVVELKEIDEADITVDPDAQGGATIVTTDTYFDKEKTHHVIIEVEGAATHSSVSLDLCPYNEDVCFATGQINIGGSIKTVSASIQADGSLAAQIVSTELDEDDVIRIKYYTYNE